MQIVVLAPDGVKVRQGPAKVANQLRTEACGKVLETLSLHKANGAFWARLKSGGFEYVCISEDGNPTPLCELIVDVPQSAPTLQAWATEMDAWARNLGYKGALKP